MSVKDKYKNMSIQEKVDVLRQELPVQIARGLTDALEKIAKNKKTSKVTLDFRKKLSPRLKAKFIDDEPAIYIGRDKIQLPPTLNEHFLCRAMFSRKSNEVVDWSVIYEQITGYYREFCDEPLTIRENWRVIYDAMLAVNKRFREEFNEDLFVWQEKTIKRLR